MNLVGKFGNIFYLLIRKLSSLRLLNWVIKNQGKWLKNNTYYQVYFEYNQALFILLFKRGSLA